MKTSAIITAEDKLNHLKTLFYRLRMRAAYERLTSILSDPDECGMSALDCIYEIMENEVQRRDSNASGRTHQKLSNEPRYRSPFIGDLTRGTF